MNFRTRPPALPPSQELTPPVSTDTIAQLVGQVYTDVAPTEKSRLIEHLLRPLGVLSLVSVANGIFAHLRFRSEGAEMRVRPEDAQNIQASDIISLANHVQQVSVHAVNGLTSLLAASPVMTRSAAAVLLMTVLVQRAKARRADDYVPGRIDHTAHPAG